MNFFLSALLLLIPQSFQLMGTIRDETGRSVTGIKVSLLDENYVAINTVFADSTGRFGFRAPRSGRISIRVETFGTDYEERLETLDLQALSPRRNAVEPIIMDLVLISKRGVQERPANGTLFSQEVPEKARAEFERGLECLRKNRQAKAIECFRKGIAIFQDYYAALEALGVEYIKEGNYEAALPVLNRALEINERGERSLYALGVAQLRLKHYPEALVWLERAKERAPLSVNVQMMLGLAHGHLGQLDQSESCFKRACLLGGRNAADAHLYLAGINNARRRYSEAAKELEAFLEEATEIKEPGRVQMMIDGLKKKDRTDNQ